MTRSCPACEGFLGGECPRAPLSEWYGTLSRVFLAWDRHVQEHHVTLLQAEGHTCNGCYYFSEGAVCVCLDTGRLHVCGTGHCTLAGTPTHDRQQRCPLTGSVVSFDMRVSDGDEIHYTGLGGSREQGSEPCTRFERRLARQTGTSPWAMAARLTPTAQDSVGLPPPDRSAA
jgi:hypothetical protein